MAIQDRKLAMKSIYDVFDSEMFMFPFDSGNRDYFSALKLLFWKYKLSIRQLDINADFTKEIQEQESTIILFCRYIVHVLQEYFAGHTHSASTIFKEFIGHRSVAEAIKALSESDMNDEECYFRARMVEYGEVSVDGIAHVPLDLRHRIKNSRYGLAGRPCLYLGGSSWICWEELGRPPFDKIRISRFKWTGDKFRFLNFSLRPRIFSVFRQKINRPNPSDKSYTDYLERLKIFLSTHLIPMALCWPLLAACSFVKKHPDSFFSPEYVIPQLLMDWIGAGGTPFSGIAYHTTRIKGWSSWPHLATNYVIPISESKQAGLSFQLMRHLSITTPVSWVLAQHGLCSETGIDRSRNPMRRENYRYDREWIELSPGQMLPYAESLFYKVDTHLCDLGYNTFP